MNSDLFFDVLRDCKLGSDRTKATPHCRGICQLGEPEEDIRRSMRSVSFYRFLVSPLSNQINHPP